ncbi:MAG TPA: helix-turn-helix transcriptional regulator, partial [Pirellulales bacterium]|nr:helix-turn-helix transcriptional regulator [Pirellulales bacterium]
MDAKKRHRLEQAGWKVGTVQEFLQLSDADAAYIDIKAKLAASLAARRSAKRYTQEQLAKLLGSSQSRVAKMEIADGSVSLDLLVRSLLALGAKPSEIAQAIRQPR